MPDLSINRAPSRFSDANESNVAAHYTLQAEIYALALVRVLGIDGAAAHAARFGGLVYVYLRGLELGAPGRGMVFQRPSWAELLEWQDRLAARGAALAGGGQAPDWREG